MKILTKSPEETARAASDLGKKYLKKGGLFALIGDLGAGKTTFTQGFAKGLGIKERVISPTFVLLKTHKIPKTNRLLHHLDLYRLEGDINILEMGIQEILENSKNLTLIEWADKIEDKLPANTIVIKIQRLAEDQREISIKGA